MRYRRQVEPLASGLISSAWGSGTFDAGHRSFTDFVEGSICIPQHLVLVTLSGQAKHLEVTSSCGHRYHGHERANMVSFVPAHHDRQFRLHGVEAAWASISFAPALLGADDGRFDSAMFTNKEDAFISSLLREFVRLYRQDGRLDATYCDAMVTGLAHYIAGRYGQRPRNDVSRATRIPAWRMRQITDYIDAHLAEPVRIADLAELVDLSSGYLHRALRETTGKTPLCLITERRIEHAMALLQRGDLSVLEVSLQVGFTSPSHFARTFRKQVGVSPSLYRRAGGKASEVRNTRNG